MPEKNNIALEPTHGRNVRTDPKYDYLYDDRSGDNKPMMHREAAGRSYPVNRDRADYYNGEPIYEDYPQYNQFYEPRVRCYQPIFRPS